MNTKKYDIICMSFPAWDGDYVKSTVKLMSAIAQSQRVIFVDYAYTWKDVLMGVVGKHKFIPWKRVLGFKERIRLEALPQGNIEVLSLPPVIPVNWTKSPKILKGLIRLNAWMIKKVLQKKLKENEVYDPIVINALNPVYGNALAGKLNEQLLVYYCYDEIQAGKWMTKHGYAAEEAYLQKVDMVITSSEKLKERKSEYHPDCYTVNNGVDLDIFMLGSSPEQRVKTSPNKQIIGYLGSVDHRLDVKLIDEILHKFPQAELHFVGRVTSPEHIKRYEAVPNVFFQGPQPPDKLAYYLGKFDVGIIPFIKNEFTEGIYPMKINEYLAAGLRVVSTRFGDMDSFETVAHICDTHEEFLQALSQNLFSEDEKVPRMERIHFAQQNTWERRAVEFLDILNNKLGGMSRREEIVHEEANINH